MKVLLLSPFFSYPEVDHAGGQIIYQRQKYMPSDVEVTLVSFIHPLEKIHLSAAREVFHEIHTVDRIPNPDLSTSALFTQRTKLFWLLALTRKPFLIAKFYSPAMASLINRLVASDEFNLIQVEYSYMTQYLPPGCRKPSIFLEHEAALFPTLDRIQKARGLKRWLLEKDLNRWKSYMERAYFCYDKVLVKFQ